MTEFARSLSVTTLKGVGPRVAECLSKLHILTVADLLFHLPFRYEDRTKIKTLAALSVGDRVLIEGEVLSAQLMGARQYLQVLLVDESGGRLKLNFYNFAKGHQKKLSQVKGAIRCFGEVRQSYSGGLEMVHPEYASATHIQEDSLLAISDRLSPVYPLTKGLHLGQMRKLMLQALGLIDQGVCLQELLPENLCAQFGFGSLADALTFIHFPPVQVDQVQLLEGKHPALQRLVFEELMAHHVALLSSRGGVRHYQAKALPSADELEKKLLLTLPFSLTHAQQRVVSEIKLDMATDQPMLRLVQGDVGSGKTIVACMAALQALSAGAQVAFMAPTEILVEQHAARFTEWLAPLGIKTGCLTGKLKSAEQEAVKSALASGEIKFIVGTHALFQESVCFSQLALLIIDEQHRFGVHQRLALMKKGRFGDVGMPHQLIMTATPIPRTLAMSVYADLDCSVIDELPPGRQPIKTVLLANEKRDAVIERVSMACQNGGQAYWICTLIDESEVLDCEAAEKTAVYLQQQLPGLNVGLVHGRLSGEEKAAVMSAFEAGDVALLVATTVVEVGVDVPNASLMIIENPERLGLSQLHQLRGRVGRGSVESFCVLLYQSPLSETAKKRLQLMRETTDGFQIAREDMAIRGPGEVLGVRQSGLMRFKVADLLRDEVLIPKIQSAATDLLKQSPDSAGLLVMRWIGKQLQYLNA